MPQLGVAGPDRPRVAANNRYRAGEASIRSSEEQDRSRHHSAHPHRGGLELLVSRVLLARLYRFINK